MKVHMLKHRDMDIFDCSTCEFTSNNAKSLKHHTEIHHSQLFKCEYCRRRMTKHSLMKHWEEVHGIREVSTENVEVPGSPWKDAPLKLGSSCSISHHAVTLKTEVQDQDGIINNQDAQGLVVEGDSEFNIGEFAEYEIEKFYACSVCEFSSHLKVLLKFHVLIMHTQKSSCKHCSAVMTKYALIEHYKNVHGIHVYFDGKGFREGTSQSMKLGFLTHSEDYQKSKNLVRNPKKREVFAKLLRKGDKFICSICKYSSKSSIEAHIDKLHRRKFFCIHCPAIMTKYALVDHARLKHGVTLSLKNRFIKEAKPHMYSRPALGSDGEESDVSEEDADRDNASSNPSRNNASIIRKGDKFVCSVCRYSNTVRSKLERHVDKVHVKKFHCKHCSEIMTKHELVEHCMTMHGIVCSTKTPGLKEFSDVLDDTNHRMDYDENDAEFDHVLEDCPSTHTDGVAERDVAGPINRGQRFACSICDFSSHNEWSLTCHLKFLHTVKYHCNHCPAIMTKHDIMKHTLNEHGIEIRSRGPSGLREAREDSGKHDLQNIPVTAGKVLTADNFIGHFIEGTQNHSDTWQNVTIQKNVPLSCTVCDFTARSNWHVRKHMESFHQKKFSCAHCPAVMTQHELINHAWCTHGIAIKSKNSKLEEVADLAGSSDMDGGVGSEYDSGTSFQNKSSLKKPCPFCDYTAQDCMIKVHVERMHTAEYCCEHCAVVLTKYELIKHYKKEHGYNLSGKGHRGYRFKKADSCTEQTNHSNEASKVCSSCNYTSSILYNIDAHEENMHKVKYQCEHCPAVMTKYDLIRHYRNDHGIDAPLHSRSYHFRKASEQGDSDQASIDQVVKIEPGQVDLPGPSSDVSKSVSNISRMGCSFCDYNSAFLKDVTVHEERMHRIKFHCGYCSVVMVKHDLLQHIMIKHGVALPSNYRFVVAKNELGQDADDHMEVQSEVDYPESEASSVQSASKNVCSVCGYVGIRVHHLQSHVERMHTRRFYCEHCTAVMTKYELLEHYKSLHGVPVSDGGRGMRFVEAASHETNGYMLNGFVRCSVCDFSTKSKLSHKLHMESWHRRKYVCNDCPVVMTKHEIIEHSKDVHGVTIPRLGKQSRDLRPADDPVEQTHPTSNGSLVPVQSDPGFKTIQTGTFECTVCDYSAIYRKSMLIHVVNMHRKKYSCNHCSAIMSKYELVLHSKDVHGLEIPYNGRGYVFKQVTQEDRCNDSQAGETSDPGTSVENDTDFARDDETGKFKCPHCEFASLYPSNLKCHIDSIHTKLFCCNKCSVVMTKYDLRRHFDSEHDIQVNNFKFRGCKEYQPGSEQINTTSSEQCVAMDVQDGSRDADDESEFIISIAAPPRLTLKPETITDSSATSASTEDIQRFIRLDGDGETFSCSICGVSSKYKTSLMKHVKFLHSRKLNCGSCSAIMTKYDLIQHCKTAHDVTILSNVKGCSFQELDEVTGSSMDFSREDGVSEDAAATDDNDDEGVVNVEGGFKCSVCGIFSVWRRVVRNHFLFLHRKKYSCNQCSVILTKYEMIQHYETVHNLVVEKSGRGKTRRFFRAVDDVSEGADESVYAATDMNADGKNECMSITHKGGQFKCSVCSYSTALEENLSSHFESHHFKKYSCNRCSAILNKYEMIQHYETNHDVLVDKWGRGNLEGYFKNVGETLEGMDESDYADNMADCSAQDNEEFTIIEEGEQFKCSICGHSTTFKYNLKPHFESFHRRRYSCNRCSVVTTKYGIVCHYENTHCFVIPNLGKGNLAPYCQAIDENELSGVTDSSVFADGMVETVMDGPVNAEVDADFPDSRVGTLAGHTTAEDEFDEAYTVIKEDRVFKCVICGHTGYKKHNITSHIEALHKKKYSCNRCSLVMAKYDMIRHYESDHDVAITCLGRGNTEGFFKPIDGVSAGLGSADLADVPEQTVVPDCPDETVPANDGNKCSICDYTTHNAKSGLDRHLKAHHEKKYSCNQCSMVLTKYEMVKHYESDHSVKIQYQGLGAGGYMATYCRAVNSALEEATSSDLALTPMVESAAPESADCAAPDRNDGFTYKEGAEFRCSVCDFSAMTRPIAEKHLLAFHKRTYSCNRCSLVMSKYDMLQHFESEHNLEIPYKGRGNMFKYFTPVDGDPYMTDLAHSHSSANANTSEEASIEEVEEDEMKCTLCDFTTIQTSYLVSHLSNMHTKRFTCTRCSIILTKHDMIQHCEDDHGVTINKKCSRHQEHFVQVSDRPKSFTDDDKTFADSADGENPVRSESEGIFPCTICDFSTKHGAYLETHMVNLHTKKYACDHCPAVLTKYDLMKHCEHVHGMNISPFNHNLREVVADERSSDNYSDDTDPPGSSALKGMTVGSNDNPGLSLGSVTGGFTKFNCALCDFSSRLRVHLNLHTKNMHSTKLSCNACSIVMTKHELHNHYKDVHCTKPSPSKEAKQSKPDSGHKDGGDRIRDGARVTEAIFDINTNEQDVSDAEVMQARNTYDCSICGFTTKAKWYLKDHVDKFHRRKYCCWKCPAVMTKYVLIKHCKNVHGVAYSSRQPLVEVDDKNSFPIEGSNMIDNRQGTAASSDLAKSNTQPDVQEADQDGRVQCSQCDFSTPNRWYLKDHTESFHKKKYSCRLCLAVMTKHELVKHSNDIHGLILKRLGKLPSASAKPLGDSKSKYSEFKKPKRFPCDICSFSSFHPFGLKRHIKIQHTIKYSCQHCSAVMTRHALIKHCRVMHNSQILENPPNAPESKVGVKNSEPHHPSNHSDPSFTQVINPKFQSQRQKDETVQSVVFQPVVYLERLYIDVKDLDSTFSVVDNTATDSAKVKNPKFQDTLFDSH